MTFSELVRERIDRGITGAHVARKMGITPGYLHNLETGYRRASEAQIAAYRAAIGLEVSR